jgi:sterol desaturase/sphingolipid hydroxylase (fatty acid hydroxylase superfamily)
VTHWAEQTQFGLLQLLSVGAPTATVIAVVMLDAWMYVWHRANHAIPALWRFHRMHHSDACMDVTTATRFHLGEHAIGGALRLGIILLLGLHAWHIVIYELLVLLVTQFHHANISLGKLDRWLRIVFVTPDMHKIHHSRLRVDVATLQFGLDGFNDERRQTICGMLTTPFVGKRGS